MNIPSLPAVPTAKAMQSSRHLKAIRAALLNLLNDTAVAERTQLRTLELIETAICGFIADLQARLPELGTNRKEPGR